MSQDLIAYFDQRFSETSHQIQQLQQHVEQQIQQQVQMLREEMQKGFEEADLRLRTEIRLTHVAIEGVRGEVRLVAEGVEGVNQRLLRSQQEVNRGLEPRVTRLENRVSALEAAQEE